jgi:DNA-directed RNA polymerase subunit M/transcription elongation factor TFIIS
MIHTGPVPGSFTGDKIESPTPCRRCAAVAVSYRTWESSDGAYEDRKYRCAHCGHEWWIEGPDA